MDVRSSKIPRLKPSLPRTAISTRNVTEKLDDSLKVNTSKSQKVKKVSSTKTVSTKAVHNSGKYKKAKNVRSKYASYSNPKSSVNVPEINEDEVTLLNERNQQQALILEMEKKLKDLSRKKHEYLFKTQHETAQITELDKEIAKLKFSVEELTRDLQKERANLIKEEDHQRTYEAELKLVTAELGDMHKQENLKAIKLKDLKNTLAKLRGQQGAKSVSFDNRSDELQKVVRTHEAEIANVQAQVDEIHTRIEHLENEKKEKQEYFRCEIEQLNRKLEYTQNQLIRANKSKDEIIKLYNFLNEEAKKILGETETYTEFSFDVIKDSYGKVPMMTEEEMKSKILAFKMSLEHAQDTLVLYAKEKTRLIQVMSMNNPDLQLHLSRTEKFLENLQNETSQLRKNINFLNNDLRNKSQLIKTLEDNLNVNDAVEHVKIKYLRNTLLAKMKRACDLEQRILRLKYYSKLNEQRISKNKYLITIRDSLLQNADKTIKQMDVLKGHFRIIIDQHYLMSLKFNKQVTKLKETKHKLDKIRNKAKEYENKVVKLKVKTMFTEQNQDEWLDVSDEPSLEDERCDSVQLTEDELDNVTESTENLSNVVCRILQ